ncbi:hypothetical protein AALB39_27665 [Lachnospiraceae bacterium 54-53]
MSVKYAKAVVDGITYDLTLGDDGLYHAVIPAPRAPDTDMMEYRSYGVNLQTEDDAGNITIKNKGDLGENLWLVVKKNIFITTRHWEPPDYFNVADYNRIKSNICYLKQIADALFDSVEFVNMGSDKSWEEYPTPEEFRLMEQNLNYICEASGLPAEQYSPHLGNQPFSSYEDLNQIEDACQKLFDRLYGIIKARRRLPFTLGKRGIL